MRIYEMKEKVRDMFVEQREGRAGVLCHEYVIHADDVDLVDALRLELVILLDVSRRLRMARRREGPRHADLQQETVGQRLRIVITGVKTTRGKGVQCKVYTQL